MQNRYGTSNGNSKRNLLTEAASLVVFGMGVFSLAALSTYHAKDPSFFTNSVGPAINACGKVGGYVSSLLLECFGMGAFLFPALLFFAAVTLYKREGSVRLLAIIGTMAVAVMSFTVFIALQMKYWSYAGVLLLTGGAFGLWLTDLLASHFNSLGASIVSLSICAVALAISTPISVAKWGGAFLKWFGGVTWKMSRLLAGYLIYLTGLAAMRMSHAVGDGIQTLLETIAERRRLAKIKPVEEVVSQVIEISQSMPDIPLEVEAENETENETENELEVQSAPQTARSPEILPPEIEKFSKAQDIATKAAAKLARAARSIRMGQWQLPPVEFLKKAPKIDSQIDKDRLIQNSQILRQKFLELGVDGEVTAVRPGPVITLYEYKPGPGVKVAKVAALADDLKMALSAESVRILAPLPGKAVVGIEIPSDNREMVFIRDFLSHPDFHGNKHQIPVVMGKDIAGQAVISDLARMPHLLCAGQTGSGKSVFMNGLICSLFYRFTPDQLRMILVDPKFIEFRAYQDIPHLLLPVVDDASHASTALKWAVREMDRRYRILATLNARNLAAYNQKVDDMGVDVVRDLLFAEENQPEGLGRSGGDWVAAFEPDETGAPRVGKLPYIVIIIDELADLMMVSKKEVEISIARIAQKARAAGIHLVIATQRPSTDVITGLIKANLPSRVSFQLASYIDSRTILDRPGAERLLGQGDMLFIPPGTSQLVRLHGAYVEDGEIEKITAFLKNQGKPVYRDEILVDEDEDSENGAGEDDDELFQEAIELVKRTGHASASFLQRHLKVGYNRAARMIETMENRGVVGPADGARPREVLLR